MKEKYIISGSSLENGVSTGELTLEFAQKYEDFPSFVEKTTDPIYRAIIDAFNDVKIIGKMRLRVQAYVDNTKFDTVFEYTKDDAYILKEVINPYFEGKEDYETCKKIMELYFELTQR
jgi:hypothetical protein